MIKSGIYIWRNKLTNRVLVGSSSNLSRRKSSYLCSLKRGKYINKHFQRSWDKYNSSNFEFIILEEVDKRYLIDYEQSYLNYYKSLPFGVYNQIGPINNPKLGAKSSTETKNKQSESMKRFHKEIGVSLDTRLKISKANTGIKHKTKHRPRTEAEKQFISELHIGRIVSIETREKLRIKSTGRRPSEETRAKMRASKALRKKQGSDMIDK